MAQINYYEQVVVGTSGKNAKTIEMLKLITFLIASIGLAMFFYGVFNPNNGLMLILGIIVTGLGVFFYWRKDYLNRDYEYMFLEGEIELACVVNNAKRRTIKKFDIGNITAMGRTTNSSYNKIQSLPGIKKIKATLSKKPNENVYYCVVEANKKLLITFEPDKTMLTAMQRYLKVRVDL